MTTITKSDIVIIGGGFSGTLTAVNLLNLGLGDKEVVIIDSNPQIFRGLAYGTWDDNLLLNVPAGNMSALHNMPDHFLRYCQTIDPAFNGGSFVSRRIYGDYLEFALTEAEQKAAKSIKRTNGTVLSVHPQVGTDHFCVSLADGTIIQTLKVVLALGHFQPQSPLPSTQLNRILYISNPWDVSALDHVPRDKQILILGTGLTAIDALFKLTSTGHKNITLMSRKGLLPHPHRATPKPPSKNSFPHFLDVKNLTVRYAIKALRESIRSRCRDGEDWRDAINELRPYTPEIWSKFSTTEKKRFLRHVVGFWDIHRHRLSPVAYNRLEKLIATEQATILAGRLVDVTQQRNKSIAIIQPRGGAENKQLSIGTIINCTGPNSDVGKVTSPLIQQLLSEGLIASDELGLGILINDQYEVINANNKSVAGLHYVGPLLKSKYWEAIAVPELRRHSQQVADFILA
jgi:uncharacterized NAD(P)/FAD-binding protein YdhS